jgi:hypothetical protein
MNWSVVFQGLSLLVAMTTLALALVKFANRKAAAFEQAQNALALMKALREQSEAETDAVNIRTSKALQERLLVRSLYASQMYVARTEPLLVNYAQVALLGTLTVGYCIYFLFNPLIGIPEEVSAIVAAAFLMIGAGGTWWAATLVMTHRTNQRQLLKGILVVPAEKDSRISWRQLRQAFSARTNRWLAKN